MTSIVVSFVWLKGRGALACCIVAAVVLTILYRVTPWRKREFDAADFAPVASRPVPGQADIETVREVKPVYLRPVVAASAWVLRFAAAGAIGYLLLTGTLAWSGLIHVNGSGVVWVIRCIVVVAVAGTVAVLGARWMREGLDPSSRRQIAGFAAIGCSLVLIEAMAVDMHVLQLYHLHNTHLHDAVHIGALMVLIGGAILIVFSSAAQREGA